MRSMDPEQLARDLALMARALDNRISIYRVIVDTGSDTTDTPDNTIAPMTTIWRGIYLSPTHSETPT